MKRTNLHIILSTLLTMLMVCSMAYAEEPTRGIFIGGDVYGGGKKGAVCKGNTKAENTTDAAEVTLTTATEQATSVTIESGEVRTVFGGGQNGRVYGQTSVAIKGGVIGADTLSGYVSGGVFGAGDGAGALVFGTQNTTTITGGTIWNNVYGGGNQANLYGNTNVLLQGGTYKGSAFGGARMADISGTTDIKLDGTNVASGKLLAIKYVYGGNDISGTVARQATVTATGTHANVFAEQVYGGGNGDYAYDENEGVKSLTLKVPGTLASFDFTPAVLYANAEEYNTAKGTNLSDDVFAALTDKEKIKTPQQGTAAVLESTKTFDNLIVPDLASARLLIYNGMYDQVYGGGNNATVTGTTSITLQSPLDATQIPSATATQSGLSLFAQSDSHALYQIERLFGGNNKVAMAIQPSWILTQGSVHNLYSGGNKGDMTGDMGIALTLNGDNMQVYNVYGGCRMANVAKQATVTIAAGTITNVYGGNDVSGNVVGGTNVNIRSSVIGDVYGGGNGSYAYTDKTEWVADHPGDADYYYNPGTNSVEALNNHRPNASKVNMWIEGTQEKPVFIGGSLYCGGNSATLRAPSGLSYASANLIIGSYVTADKVFLGSNGDNMVSEAMLRKYAENEFSTLTLTDAGQFDTYMQGVEVAIKPQVNFVSGYVPYSSKFGSLYCGGNRGSMTAEGQFTISFLNSLVIYDKIVGGSNNANVVAREGLNAFHQGGLTKAMSSTATPKVLLNISGVKLEPRKLVRADDGSFSLQWNKDASGNLVGANIYGGCYESGYVNGGVTINVTQNAISEDVFGGSAPSGADYAAMLNNPLVSTMSVYGGGYGQETEIWGNTAINVTNDAHIFKVYGGGEQGIIGKMQRDAEGNQQTTVNPAYGTTVTLNATAPTGSGNGLAAVNAAKMYGGGYEGLVTGDTHVNLNQGRVYDAFGGACNADIQGVAEMIVGYATAPTVDNNIYAGNDFGGQILGTKSHAAHPYSGQWETVDYDQVVSNTYLEYHKAKMATGSIFGGPCGAYDYSRYERTESGETVKDYISLPTLKTELTASGADKTYAANSFVNVISSSYNSMVPNIFGGGQGLAGKMGNADMYNTYVLLHASALGTKLAENIYGAGDCSTTTHSLVDAYGGQYGTIFGGCHGTALSDGAQGAHQSAAASLTYMGETSTVNLHDGMTYRQTDIYGAGAYSGTKQSTVNLMGGYAHNIYGASLNEGITYASMVNVPETSTAHVNAIFGGAKGANSSYACDVYNAFVNYQSANAAVEQAIYGGNQSYRFTRASYVDITAPVRNTQGTLTDVYGAGYGEDAVAEYTSVKLGNGAQAGNVYGGGQEGKVYDKPSMTQYLSRYYTRSLASYLSDIEAAGYDTWMSDKTINNIALVAHQATPVGMTYSTNVTLASGSTVGTNAYGGGFGTAALVAGQTGVTLQGGYVGGDIYGGGLGGDVKPMDGITYSDDTYPQTFVTILGGEAGNVYGGGLRGHVEVAADTVATHVTLGTFDQADPTYANGLPAIRRSLYGGGEKGHVYGKALTTINNGYIGYSYDAARTLSEAEEAAYTTAISEAQTKGNTAEVTRLQAERTQKQIDVKYVAFLDLHEAGDRLLKDNGNVFGGGYGEGASVDQTEVNFYAGTIRNSIHGGGEIAAVGRATLNEAKTAIDSGTKKGTTQVRMYGGLVNGNVFGGGRGFAIDEHGNNEQGATLYTDGYVFGTTDVGIHGGTVGTTYSVGNSDGNVFGGGNIGYVYSYEGIKNRGIHTDGYYYDKDEALTEDCKVVIAPYAKVTAASVTINNHSYTKGDYVTIEDLNTLGAQDGAWSHLDQTGIIISNAVFAGGNVSRGSDRIYANTKTIFGNATASVIDVFSKDLITLGDDGVGGLYGDGNLTFVDGYRELNISNYGTDYYNLNNELTIDEYYNLNDRERAYFELKYKNNTDGSLSYDYYEAKDAVTYILTDNTQVAYHRGQWVTETEYNSIRNYSGFDESNWSTKKTKSYDKDAKITDSEYELMYASAQANWTLAGFCTLYAGRMMNTIQRADFCGVFGSRIVLKGAQDRVPSVVDYTDYTINRVKELSLNQRKVSGINHGNYFGIYSVVNYLGALTSDVDFYRAVRTTDSQTTSNAADATTTYSKWKQDNLGKRNRNNGSCVNEVALASGVWLEIVDESTETNKDAQGKITHKNYGPITGVVQLDLLNVATGEGGGYVYARNEHGVQSKADLNQRTLTSANTGAITQKIYSYNSSNLGDMQTSGNFVNSVKRIVDDCFPQAGQNSSNDVTKAHYWYIRGDFYVHDQYISAYTGTAQSYAEQVSIPLTITAEAQGQLKLESVNQNRYAYWTASQLNSLPSSIRVKGTSGDTIIVNNLTYAKNDPISYYDWSHLTDPEKAFFQDMLYMCTTSCKIGGQTFKEGDLVKTDYYTNTVKTNTDYVCTYGYYNGLDSVQIMDILSEEAYNALDSKYKDNYHAVNTCFHPSNEISHENGYLLTFGWDNPDVWNQYYHHKDNATILRSSSSDSKTDYILSPTFKVKSGAGGVMGQMEYGKGDVIDAVTYGYQQQVLADLGTNNTLTGQATFDSAYVAKEECHFTDNGTIYNYVVGAPIAKSVYTKFSDANKLHFEKGYTVTETYQDASTTYLYGEIVPLSVYNTITKSGTTNTGHFSAAFICTDKGKWGGQVYDEGKNYSAIQYGNVLPTERTSFNYNYDALDLLSENFNASALDHYQGASGNNANGGTAVTSPIPFTEKQALDYTAVYNDADMTAENKLSKAVAVKRGTSSLTTDMLQKGDTLTNTVFESLTNEQANYAAIVVKGSEMNDNYYVVTTGFQLGDSYYSSGKVVSEDVYNNLANASTYITVVPKASLNAVETLPTNADEVVYYFCKKGYGSGNNAVALGTIKSKSQFEALKNEQKNFSIEGKMPAETATLYVARGTDINDLKKDKIVTAIYNYEYIESDDAGNYENICERHIINIHIHFESGVPTVGELLPPSTVLPGATVGLNQPYVAKGAYEILGGGWEMFTNLNDANSRKNGIPYTNSNTTMYWYQDGYYVAYYAKSYLGKTYSNPVQFSVANYHNIEDVMASTHVEEEMNDDGSTTTDQDGNVITKTVNDYMYINEAVKAGKRNPKIYIADSQLSKLADLYTLTAKTDAEPVAELSEVANCQKLDFLLKEDIHQTDSWTSLGSADKCFAGDLHGNGHTISGLDHSLFSYFGGNVYNLGVTGSFTGAGIADVTAGCTPKKAYNCWVATTGTPADGTKAIFGDAVNGQLVNCYYPTTNAFTEGEATAMPVESFLNGEVAYDLNGFYLQARYKQNAGEASYTSDAKTYNYYVLNGGSLMKETTSASSSATTKQLNATVNSITYETTELPYVEDYVYGTPDFCYADDTIYATKNIRRNPQGNYYPIYPDDYIFFGQKLTFDTDHAEHPGAVVKENKTGDEVNTKLIDMVSQKANRVFRTPGYYLSSLKQKAHFNAEAMFAADYTVSEKAPYTAGTYHPYADLTALDFTAHNDAAFTKGYDTSAANEADRSIFYAPATDFSTLTDFKTNGVTQNLLTYVKNESAAGSPASVTASYLRDPVYSELTQSETVGLHSVEQNNATVNGHLVKLTGDKYVAESDQLLIDKQNFNCPISYSFVEGKRMWYQREPDETEDLYVDRTKGWESVSLPFTAEMITTSDKGELTHFYDGSTAGHEYWLREYTGRENDQEGNPVSNTINMAYPQAATATKIDANTFLWDYYYSWQHTGDDAGPDANTDLYQTYYKSARTYEGYPLQQKATPYLVGFPGSTYYEFDLSGQFTALHTQTAVPTLAKQTITWVSAASTEETPLTVNVSDEEYDSGKVNKGDFIYHPTYQTRMFATAGEAYNLSADGSTFEKNAANASVLPFRTYFTATSSGAPDRLNIGAVSLDKGVAEPEPEYKGDLVIYAAGGYIYVTSECKRERAVQVNYATGARVAMATIQPGETIRIPVFQRGIYLVNTKKVLVNW